MRYRSSIFNFRPWITSAFIYALILFIGYSVVSALLLTTLPVRNVRGPRVTQVVCTLNDALRSTDNRPLIIFIGTSKLHSAIDADYLAEEFPEYRFINLSIASMTPNEYKKVFSQFEKILPKRRVKKVIFESMDASHNINSIHPIFHVPNGIPEQYNAWATWKERLYGIDGKYQIDLIIDGIWGRQKISQHEFTILHLLKARPPDKLNPFYPQDKTEAECFENNMKTDPNFSAKVISKNQLHNYCYGHTAMNDLYEAIDIVKRAGIPTVLLHLPMRQEYYDAVANGKENYEYLKYLSDFSQAPADKVIFWKLSNECGFSEDELFADYGHFSISGRKIFSEYIGMMISKGKL